MDYYYYYYFVIIVIMVVVIISKKLVRFVTCNWCRNLPLSIAISLSAITVLYLFVNYAYFVVLSIDGVLQSEAVAIVGHIGFSCTHMN